MIRERTSQQRGVVLDGPVFQEDSKFVEWLVRSGCSLSGRDSASTGALAKVVRVDFGFSKEEAELLADVPPGAQYVEVPPKTPPEPTSGVMPAAEPPSAADTSAHAPKGIYTPWGYAYVDAMCHEKVELWPSPTDLTLVANELLARTEETQPIRYLNGTWYQYDKELHCHAEVTPPEKEQGILAYVTDRLSRAEYILLDKKTGIERKDEDTGKLITAKWGPQLRGGVKRDIVDNMRSQLITRLKQRNRRHKREMVQNSWFNECSDRVIPLRNGLLKLDGRELLEHTPNYFSTYCLSFDYAPAAGCPRWMSFLEQVFPGDPKAQALLQEWFGYVLSSRTDLQQMLMLIGDPGTGKGTIIRVLERMIAAGSRSGISLKDLGGQFGKWLLVDQTLVVFSDARVHANNTGALETLLQVIGEDEIVANRKNQPFWKGRSGARFMLASNRVPEFPDESGALKRRCLYLHTPNPYKGKKNQNFEAQLAAELSGIFNWALAGLRRLDANNGRFTSAASADYVGELMCETSSPVTRFIEGCCEVGDGLQASKDDVHDRYVQWARTEGFREHEILNKPRFSTALYESKYSIVGGKAPRPNRFPVYLGLRLRDLESQGITVK